MNTGSNILCVIYNHNHNDNSKLWLDRLLGAGFDAYIFDSGSESPIEDDRVVKYPNIYCGGMFNETIELVKIKKPDWVFHVDDDILIDDENFNRLLERINIVKENDKIGVYQASTTIGSHNCWPENKNKGTNSVRITPLIEEWMWLIRADILIEMAKYNINFGEEMKYGWGIGILYSRKSMDMGYINVVDDYVVVIHPNIPSSYNYIEASRLMKNTFGKLGTNNAKFENECRDISNKIKFEYENHKKNIL